MSPWVACLLLLAGCGSLQREFRGTDHGALLTSLRLDAGLRRTDPGASEDRVRFCPSVGVDVFDVQGDFADGGDRPDYSVFAAAVLFEPGIRHRGIRARALLGPAYFDTEVRGAGDRLASSGLAFAYGFTCSYALGDAVEPYLRFLQVDSLEARIGRLEVGAEAWVTAQLGAHVAYGRQTTRIEDDAVFSVTGTAHIVSDGIAIGMTLRL